MFKYNRLFKTSLKSFSKITVDPFSGMSLPEPVPNPNRLKNKFAIVTGGSNGIGRATVELFSKSGVSGVMIADVDEKNGKLLAEKINDERKEKIAAFVKTDMTNSKSIENAVELTVQQFGKLNVMFNNAGIMHQDDDNPVTTQEDIWDLTMSINTKSVYLCCKYGIPHILKSGGGSIINTASFVAILGAATPQIAYTASKGAVLSMTREMAIIYARQGIRFNSLCPGPIRTPLLMDFLSTEEKLNRRLVHIPMGRFGEAREIAQAVAFLASDESSYVNGASFLVDGGVTQAYTTPL
jgi:NAD(P)-dependent dehydrogenase (short-subunit alcohol dehydrogenase family)